MKCSSRYSLRRKEQNEKLHEIAEIRLDCCMNTFTTTTKSEARALQALIITTVITILVVFLVDKIAPMIADFAFVFVMGGTSCIFVRVSNDYWILEFRGSTLILTENRTEKKYLLENLRKSDVTVTPSRNKSYANENRCDLEIRGVHTVIRNIRKSVQLMQYINDNLE